jgi:hypothetical protein
MGNEQLSKWQAAQLHWLKRQVDNLREEEHRSDARPRIKQGPQGRSLMITSGNSRKLV